LCNYYTTAINRNELQKIDNIPSNFTIYIIVLEELPQDKKTMIVLLKDEVCVYIKHGLSLHDRQKAIDKELQNYFNHKNVVNLKKEIFNRMR
jgi:hypothetical protein